MSGDGSWYDPWDTMPKKRRVEPPSHTAAKATSHNDPRISPRTRRAAKATTNTASSHRHFPLTLRTLPRTVQADAPRRVAALSATLPVPPRLSTGLIIGRSLVRVQAAPCRRARCGKRLLSVGRIGFRRSRAACRGSSYRRVTSLTNAGASPADRLGKCHPAVLFTATTNLANAAPPLAFLSAATLASASAAERTAAQPIACRRRESSVVIRDIDQRSNHVRFWSQRRPTAPQRRGGDLSSSSAISARCIATAVISSDSSWLSRARRMACVRPHAGSRTPTTRTAIGPTMDRTSCSKSRSPRSCPRCASTPRRIAARPCASAAV